MSQPNTNKKQQRLNTRTLPGSAVFQRNNALLHEELATLTVTQLNNRPESIHQWRHSQPAMMERIINAWLKNPSPSQTAVLENSAYNAQLANSYLNIVMRSIVNNTLRQQEKLEQQQNQINNPDNADNNNLVNNLQNTGAANLNLRFIRSIAAAAMEETQEIITADVINDAIDEIEAEDYQEDLLEKEKLEQSENSTSSPQPEPYSVKIFEKEHQEKMDKLYEEKIKSEQSEEEKKSNQENQTPDVGDFCQKIAREKAGAKLRESMLDAEQETTMAPLAKG